MQSRSDCLSLSSLADPMRSSAPNQTLPRLTLGMRARLRTGPSPPLPMVRAQRMSDDEWGDIAAIPEAIETSDEEWSDLEAPAIEEVEAKKIRQFDIFGIY